MCLEQSNLYQNRAICNSNDIAYVLYLRGNENQMTTALYFGVAGTNLLAYLIPRNKKKNFTLILIPSLIILGIIFSYGIANADMQYYSLDYATVEAGFTGYFKGTEIGFFALTWICKRFSLGLLGLRFAIFLLSTLFLVLFSRKVVYNYHLFIVLYTSFLFIINDIQLRNLIAMSISAYAFTYLNEDSRLAKMKYCFWIMFAMLFHMAAVFNFVLLLVELRNRKLLVEIVAITSISLELLFILDRGLIRSLSSLITPLLGSDSQRAEQYLTTQTNGSFNVVLLIVLGIVLTWFCYESLQLTDRGLGRFYEKVYYATILQIVWLPLLWLNVEFYRFPRNMLLLINVLVCNYFVVEKRGLTLRKLKIIGLLVITTIAWIIVAYSIISEWDAVIIPIFEHNLLLNG